MANSNPALDRTGKPQNFATRLTAQINWERRAILGLAAQVNHNILWAMAHPEWETLSPARREALTEVAKSTQALKDQAKKVAEQIDAMFENTSLYTKEIALTKKNHVAKAKRDMRKVTSVAALARPLTPYKWNQS